uniref:ATP synthase complex subunit 8 n=1 Tax=Molannodes epaphos TaxID=2904896 RepID=A0A9E8LP34_9NEOP|nr:ATP synthase F0 subunit 8 [Molannodes epaphos]UZZ44172.1 ATP synthase F0 subunit 8 [Molannodes epaphos]
MPQMLPMNWILLFLMFNITLTIFFMVNYYSFISQVTPSNSNKINFKINLKSWLW